MPTRSRRRPPSVNNLYMVEMQGFNVLSNHFLAMAELSESFFPQLLQVSADIGVETAQELVPYDSGDTYRSISIAQSGGGRQGVVFFGKGNYTIMYGAETFYAPFVEHGTRFQSPQPFIIPSGDLVEKIFLASVKEFLKLVDTDSGGLGFGGGNPLAGQALRDSRIKGSVSGFRSLLYSTSKFLGDVSIFGGRQFLGPTRAVMLNLAQLTGDVSSVMRGTLDTRVSTRLRGRAIGRISGFGVASLSHGQTYSAFPGGEGGRRIYSRTIGRGGSFGLSALSFVGF